MAVNELEVINLDGDDVALVAHVAHVGQQQGQAGDDVALVAHVAHTGQEHDPMLADVLDRIDKLLARWVAFPTSEARWAVAAWIVHTWCIDAFESTPRLALLSAERGSGKTRALEVIELLVPTPIHTVNISAAALFRQIADQSPTLLLDEADTYLGVRVAKDHEDLRGLVNAGHRRGAEVYRCIIDKGVKVERYDAFCPVALAGIGDLPDTIVDRSVVIPMKRRAPTEKIEPFRHRKALAATEPVKDLLEANAERWIEAMEDYEPVMPAGIEDRPADVWEALVIIGDHAGEPWDDRVRQAATEMMKARQERDPSLGVQLLSDCRQIFSDKGVDRLTTEDLLEALNGLEESPWGDLRGQPLDARGLARRIRKFGTRPGDHRFGEATRKGYLVADFHDAWTRYLPPATDGQHGQHGQQAAVEPVEAKQAEVEPVVGQQAFDTATDGQHGQQGQQCDRCDQPATRLIPHHATGDRLCSTCCVELEGYEL